jgi:hypothetical protein
MYTDKAHVLGFNWHPLEIPAGPHTMGAKSIVATFFKLPR